MAAHVYVCAVYGNTVLLLLDASAHIAYIASPPPLSLMVSGMVSGISLSCHSCTFLPRYNTSHITRRPTRARSAPAMETAYRLTDTSSSFDEVF